MKTVPQITAAEAAALAPEGAVLMAGGFGMTGNPVHLLNALAERGTGGLTFIGNNVGEPGLGGGRLLRNGQLKKAIGSFFTSNPEAVKAYQAGTIEIQLIPQGSLAEALRAGGAGIAGFYTPTGAGTVVTGTLTAGRVAIGDSAIVSPLGLTARVRGIHAQNHRVEQGSFLTALDVEQHRKVCVIGHKVREKLFGGMTPIGENLRLGGRRFHVIGVMEKKGEMPPPTL